ncbi:ABC transporter substrate-binding protein [Xanthobacter sp. KR7-65]|uniref:ABC transporter substrate-binding protein n=1 Tax=Xanthobacter sp. KR7-65 TaxID=3156612 RepID=UPI0032B3D129
MKRIAAFSAILAAAALLPAAFAPAALAQGQLKTVILLQPVPQIDIRNAPWAVAEEMGYLAEEGLKVDIRTAKGASVVIQQILNGSAQYGMPPPENAVVAFQKGAALKFFFAFTSKSPFPLAVTADGPIKSLADLKGKTIGLHSLTAVQFYTTQAILDSVGLKLDRDFKLVDVGAGPAALKALETGQIAALSTNVLNYAGFENRGAKFRYLISDQVAPIFGWSLMASADYLEKNRAEAVGLARAFNRGQMFCRTQAEACVKAYYKRFPEALPSGVSEEQAVKDQLRILEVFLEYSPKAEGHPWGYYDPKAWTAVVDYMVATGQMEKPVDPAGLYTNDLLADINAAPKTKTQ